MNKKGTLIDTYKKVRNFWHRIKESYVYKLFSKILSFFGTVILVLLLALGAIMFYFNMKAKSYQEQGINYTAPFGLYTIISGSMEPNIHVYDVIVATEVKDLSQIKVGDIITFISTWDLNYGATVTHRVVSVSKTENGEFQFTTQGDANKSADGAFVTGANLVGKVMFRIPQLGRVQFFLATKMGWFIVVFIPALGIIIHDLIKIFKLYILKDKIGNVKHTKEAEKTYFEGELLESQDLTERELNKTLKLSILEEKPEETIKLKSEGALPQIKKNVSDNVELTHKKLPLRNTNRDEKKILKRRNK